MASDRDVLPDHVKPIHYDLSLFDLQLAEPWTYQGKVDIDLEIAKATKTITLNTHQLQVRNATVLTETGKTASSVDASDISYDRDSQRCTLTFGDAIPVSPKTRLSIFFEGVMNDNMAGFYRSRYQSAGEPSKGITTDGKHHYMFSTQFEACDARRAFPCFDEPNLKATFDFAIEIPNDLVALSNMSENHTASSKRNGYKVVHFQRTPLMSTYLLAWAFGDFEFIEDHTARKYNGVNLPVRVYTTRGLKEQGRLALESATKIVDYFSEVFRIDYPLPKVDLLAVHEFTAGAMENWGLITYRTTAVLFDEAASDQKYRNRVVYVVAHELAHQWFGNLVTMNWWNELWLNEGFATWVGWYAVDHLHPDWNVWAQFVTEGMQTALQLDSLRTSHPIEVQVRNALEVDQIFDSISYLKGSSVIRMLAGQLGVDTFLSGVTKYLNAHKYGNAKTSDLWTALSQVSGQDVAGFMDPWIRKIGFPVVTVAEEPGQITIRQNRFLSTGDATAEEDGTVWWIPVGLKMGQEMKDQSKEALTIRENTYRQIDTDFYKLNSGQTGFYRTNLPPQRLAKLGAVLDQLSVEDKIGLVGDSGALAFSGQGTTPAMLTLVKNFSSETNSLVWSEILANLSKARSIFTEDKTLAEGLRKFVLQLVSPAAEKIGWSFSPGEDFLTVQLRSLLIASAGAAGHEKITEEAMRLFQAHIGGDKNAIHPSLRSAVYRIAVKNGGRAAYEAVKDEFLTTTSIDGKEIALAALGQVQDVALAQDYLEFGFGGKVSMQDVHSVGGSLGNNPTVRDTVWKFIKEHWPIIEERLGGTTILVERFLRVSLQKLASHAQAQDISDFYKNKDTRRYNRGLAVVLDSIRANAEYCKRDQGPLAEWLSEQGYS